MSNLINRIKADALTARKARETDKGTFLTTLGADASMAAKNEGNREVTDADALAACKRFDKGLAEMLQARPGDAKSVAERAWLSAYMPTLMAEADLAALIDEIVNGLGLASVGPKDIGKIMGALKAKSSGLFSAEMASKMIKAKSAT